MSTQDHVVVGVNETFDDGSQEAVAWAVEEAVARQAPLRIVSAYESLLPSLPPGMDLDGAVQRRQAAQEVVAAAVELAAGRMDPRQITGEVIDASAISALTAETEGAALVVIGSRRLGPLGSAVHGSVGLGVAARAACPVVVVRGPSGLPEEGARVVAAVDATAASQDVLEFAFDFASRRGLPLQVVLCWHPDLLAAMSWRAEQPAPAKAEAWVAQAVAGWRERYPEVAVATAVLRERAPMGLVSAAEAQVLLVVGRRGRHPVAQALLGSTSHGALHHATVPVAVVPVRVSVAAT